MTGRGVEKVAAQGPQDHNQSRIVISLAGRLPLRSLAVAALLTLAPFSAFLYGTREYLSLIHI